MKPLFLKCLTAYFLSAFVISCTTNSNTTRSQRFYTIANSSIAPNAYHEPKIAAKGSSGAWIGGATGGLLGSLVGSAIDSSVEASKQRKFEKRHQSSLVFENAIDTSRLTLALDELMSTWRTQSEAAEKTQGTIEPIIMKYGLFVAKDEPDNEPILEGSVAIKFRIKDLRGKNKNIGPFYGYSRTAYPISKYIDSPDLLTKVLDEAISDARALVNQGIRSQL